MSITRRRFCRSLAAGAGLAMATRSGNLFGEGVPGDDPSGVLATPTPQQLAWQDLELGLFIHFDMVTYTGQTKPRSPADVNTYNPTKLDTDQWLETAKSMGAKYAVFVAKHCTGFLSWQSNAYPYGVKQTSWREGKGDVVRDFIASCKDIAEVRLNGKSLRVVWTAPWRVDISNAVKDGDNRLEIDIINQWPNRLIGDSKLPEERRVTSSDYEMNPDSVLLPSGLIGPVSITQ